MMSCLLRDNLPVRALAFGLLLCLYVPAWAAPGHAAATTEAYLAARDQAIASLRQPPGKALSDADTALEDAREKSELDKLQTMIRELIGPIRLPGFAPAGTISTVLVAGYVESGRLDGLAVKSRDGRTTGIVTTEPLLRAWLGSGAAQSPPPGLPMELDAAFGDDDFYSQALTEDARAHEYAELPSGLPAGQGTARVLLVLFGSDSVAPNPPDTLVAAAARSGLVAVLKERTAMRIGQIPACKAAYDRDVKAAEEAEKQSQASTSDTALFQKYAALEAASDTNFVHCFGVAIKSRPEYPALAKQASALAERAASR